MFYDCVVCLGDPCNEVHWMLLVIDTMRRRVVYIFVCVCRGLQLYAAGITEQPRFHSTIACDL